MPTRIGCVSLYAPRMDVADRSTIACAAKPRNGTRRTDRGQALFGVLWGDMMALSSQLWGSDFST